MKFSFRRRHFVLAASLLSTGALGLAWSDSTGVDFWHAADFIANAARGISDEEIGEAREEDREFPELAGLVSESFSTGFIPYGAVSDSSVGRGEGGQSANPPKDAPMDLVFEATGAGYSGSGMARYLGPSSRMDFGILMASNALSIRPHLLAALPAVQPSFAGVASREIAASEESDAVTKEVGAADSDSQGDGDSHSIVIGGASASPDTSDTSPEDPLAQHRDGATSPELGDIDSSEEGDADGKAEGADGSKLLGVVQVDEPGSLGLLVLGVLGWVGAARRVKRRASTASSS